MSKMKKIKMLITILAIIALAFVLRYMVEDKDMSGVTPEFIVPNEIESEIIKRIQNEDTSGYENVIQISILDNVGKWYTGEKYNQLENWRKIEGKVERWIVGDKKEVILWGNYIGYAYKKILIEKGNLVVIEKGEWGGALYYYPENNIESRYKIIDANIVDIYKMNGRYYAIESDVYGGKILELRKKFGKYSAKEILALNDRPYAISEVEKSTFYLVTNDELLKIVDNRIEDVILSNAFWSGLYPSSIINDQYIYIGMRGGVAKVNLNNKEIQFCDIPDNLEKLTK